MAQTGSETIRAVYVTGLRNAHAVEKQALTLIDAQLGRLQHYPAVEQRLRQHREETLRQQTRLEEILASLGEERSMLKDAAMSMTAAMTGLLHSAAEDEILKNTFANFAFENYEIAAYKSLITMSEQIGSTGLALLQETLLEEQAMARLAGPELARRDHDLPVPRVCRADGRTVTARSGRTRPGRPSRSEPVRKIRGETIPPLPPAPAASPHASAVA